MPEQQVDQAVDIHQAHILIDMLRLGRQADDGLQVVDLEVDGMEELLGGPAHIAPIERVLPGRLLAQPVMDQGIAPEIEVGSANC